MFGMFPFQFPCVTKVTVVFPVVCDDSVCASDLRPPASLLQHNMLVCLVDLQVLAQRHAGEPLCQCACLAYVFIALCDVTALSFFRCHWQSCNEIYFVIDTQSMVQGIQQM